MADKIEVGVIIKGADSATKQINKVDGASKSLGTSFQGVTDGLDKLTGGAVTAFKSATTGVKTFVKGLKLTRAAIIATGVGALVVGVVALVGAFTSTRKGANKVKIAMAAMGAVVERVTGFFQAAGTYLVTLFTEGQTAAAAAYREQIDQLPGSMQDAIDKAIELERRTQALRTSQREMSVAFAEGRAQIKEYNMVAEDVTRSLEDRLDAAQKAIDIEKDLMTQRQQNAQEEFDIATQKAAQSDSSEEDLDNLATLEVNLINIRTESAEMQTTLNNKLNIIRQQSAAAAKTEADAIALAEKEKRDAFEATAKKEKEIRDANQLEANTQRFNAEQNLRQFLKTEQEIEIEAFDAKAAALLMANLTAGEDSNALEEKLRKQRQAITDKFNADEVATAQATAQAVKAANMGLVQAGFQALNAMAKTEEGQKKLAIAQILVNQGIALSNAIAGAQASALGTGPGAVFTAPGFTASLVGMVLSSFASIKGIMNQAGAATSGLETSIPTGGGGGGGAGAQLALTPTLESFGEGTLQLPAVQAFILQNDIADAGALQAELQAQSSL